MQTQKTISQKLLKCSITSKTDHQSERFVKIEHYKLWSYMMLHKHGMRISDVSLWLWLDDKNYKEMEDIYSMAPEVLRVNKIEVFLFDEKNGYSNVIDRYVREEDNKMMQKVLLSHISEELVQSQNYEIQSESGHCIKHDVKDIDTLILGLSNEDDRVWYREL